MAHNHLADIRCGAITTTNIIGIRKVLNAAWRETLGYSSSITSPRYAPALAAMMTNAIADHHPTATGALHDSGAKVLRSPRWRKRFTEAQLAIIHGRHLRFDLIRFDPVAPHGGNYVPVWRVIGDGGTFTFRNIPWQSAWSYGLESGPVICN